MLKQGICICKNCGKEFKWCYQVPQKSTPLMDCDMIPKNTATLCNIRKSIEKGGYKLPLEAKVYCLHCEYPNEIELKED